MLASVDGASDAQKGKPILQSLVTVPSCPHLDLEKDHDYGGTVLSIFAKGKLYLSTESSPRIVF